VRGRVAVARALSRALAANGYRGEAVEAARDAVTSAYATEQLCDRSDADALLDELTAPTPAI
jgi:hypothetical protein